MGEFKLYLDSALVGSGSVLPDGQARFVINHSSVGSRSLRVFAGFTMENLDAAEQLFRRWLSVRDVRFDFDEA